MPRKSTKPSDPATIHVSALGDLLRWLSARGYVVVGPTHDGEAIRFGEIGAAANLPAGLSDSQECGSYRTVRRDDMRVFAHNCGPESLKAFLFPADRLLQTATRDGRDMTVETPAVERRPHAFVGCRACDLAGLERLDRVLLHGLHADPDYAARREACFIVAVGCETVAPTCFCASVGAGPRPESLYDLCLTEYLDGGDVRYVVEVGTSLGARALHAIPHDLASPELADLPRATAERAAARMSRCVDPDAGDLVAAGRDQSLWDDVGARCLTCGVCTAVCPTCFCHTIDDTTDLAGRHAERRRRWDSCFTMGFSFVTTGSVRYSAASRYRQWLTHKFDSWRAQFGHVGCVGCGRCITWCPVGIDLTEELGRLGGAVRALREAAAEAAK